MGKKPPGREKTKQQQDVSGVTSCQVAVWDGVQVSVVYGGEIAGVRLELAGAPGAIMRLAEVVAGAEDQIEWRDVAGGGEWARLWLTYSTSIDRRLMELVDLAAAIRFGVPGVMQLEMVLTADEAQELQAVMDA